MFLNFSICHIAIVALTLLLISHSAIAAAEVQSSEQTLATNEIPLVLKNDMTAIHQKAIGEPKGAVLLVHGWAGQMNEVGDMYKRLAKHLSQRGIASIRVNIRGESEQVASNYKLTSTFASRLTDAHTGLTFLQETYPSIAKGAVGFSLGASTVIALAGQYPEHFKSIVLWSAGGNPNAVAKKLFSDEFSNTVLEKGEATMKSWVDITVTKQHLLGMTSKDIFEPFKAYTGALLCLRGTKDHILDIDLKIINSASGNREEYRHIGNADHIFDVLNPSTNYDKRVLSQTVSWLEDTL